MAIKDRNGLDAPLAHAFGEFYRRERLINRVEWAGEKTGLLSGDDGAAIGFPQLTNVRKRLLAGAPTAIHLLQRIANRGAISFVIGEHAVTPLGNLVMKTHGFRIEASQRHRIA